jgi:hypothetical protein
MVSCDGTGTNKRAAPVAARHRWFDRLRVEHTGETMRVGGVNGGRRATTEPYAAQHTEPGVIICDKGDLFMVADSA